MLQRILNNATLMSWSKAIVTFGSAIFVMPLILAVYSEVEISFWFVVNSIIGFALLADSGFGSVLVRATSYFRSGANYLPKNKAEYDNQVKIEDDTPNYHKIVDLIYTTGRIYSILIFIVILLMLTGGVAFIWNIMTLAHHRIDFWISFLLLIPTAIFMIMTIRWSSILRGLNFVAVEARFSTLLGTIRVITYAILLSFKLKPIFLIICMLSLAIINFFYIRFMVLRWIKANSTYKGKGVFDKQTFSSLWTATWRLAGISWGNYFVEASNSLLAAQIPDARAMANFLFTARILDFVKNIAFVPFYSNIPEIYSLGAKKEFNSIKKRLSEYLVTAFAIIIGAYLLINIAGNPILHLIGIETKFMGFWFISIMCLSILFDTQASFHGSVYTSTNHIPFFWPSIISGTLVVLLGLWITPIYGLLGIISVRFLVQLSLGNWYAVYLNLKLLNWRLFDYLTQFPFLGINGISNKIASFIKSFKSRKTIVS